MLYSVSSSISSPYNLSHGRYDTFPLRWIYTDVVFTISVFAQINEKHQIDSVSESLLCDATVVVSELHYWE